MFRNRQDAALSLAQRLEKYRGQDGIVLAIPRGGVPVGYVVAQRLGFPLEVTLSKKIGHPNNREYAIGSVSLGGVTIDERAAAGVPTDYFTEQATRIQARLQENFRRFMDGRPPTSLAGKTVIVVDDGIATGHTMAGTVQAVRQSKPGRLVVAVPVAPPQAQQLLAPLVDEFVCLQLPASFQAVGRFYTDFEQVSDEEVIELIRRRAAEYYEGNRAR